MFLCCVTTDLNVTSKCLVTSYLHGSSYMVILVLLLNNIFDHHFSLRKKVHICGGICSLIIVKFFFSLLLLLRPVRANKLHFHLADAFVRIHTYIQTLMAVAAVQGANQNIRSSSVFWTHQHADQRNCTSNLLITRCWLYP